jgi:hypothetical protein
LAESAKSRQDADIPPCMQRKHRTAETAEAGVGGGYGERGFELG